MELSAHLNPGEGLGDRVLKVNHAGEHGAVNIYAGQRLVARLTARHVLPELAEFQAHEEKHRAIFQAELQRRGLSRCRSYRLCAVGGFTLGCMTGLLGASAIAATTVAVERVVLGHLDRQIQALRGKDDLAAEAVSRIYAEEREHHDRQFEQLGAGRFWVVVLSPIVAASTEVVIWLGGLGLTPIHRTV
jgi:ubiquinone biosynthesis monooxygenase Coq7